MHSSTFRQCSIGLASSPGLLTTSRLPRSSTLSLALGPGGTNSLKIVNPRSCHGHAGVVVYARTGAARDRQKMEYEFREEQDEIEEYFKKILNASVLRSEATAFRGYLCRLAKSAVKLASVIMGKPGDISPDTLHTKLMTPTKSENMVLQSCVRTFVSTAEDAYHDKVTKETIVSFLLGLERLVAVSYFMAQNTLANVADYKVISLNCGPDFGLDRDRFEYMGKMDTLKHDLNMAQPPDADRVLMYTVTDAMILTEPLVISMTCRRNALLPLVSPGRQQFEGKPCFRSSESQH